ncbi:MAG: DUF3619 family protein [Burkholderiales bacterium]|nr:DUF3619 family protein [Burkholderiales bacterium]
MNEISFALKIRQALNEGTRLSPRALARLREARERALAAQKPEPAEAHLLVAAGVLGRAGELGDFARRVLLPLVVALAGLAGIYSWQKEQTAAEVEEIDARLLADDLPIEAYLDKGFEAWLKKRTGG